MAYGIAKNLVLPDAPWLILNGGRTSASTLAEMLLFYGRQDPNVRRINHGRFSG